MENVIFLVSLVGEKVYNGKSIIGYTDDNDRDAIKSFIRYKFKLNLGKQLQNKYSYQNEIHWEYETNDDNIFVHVDLCNKIE